MTTYLMCPPTYFDVVYSINEWMDPSAPVDQSVARRQWQALVDTYRALGHEVLLVDPVPGLPDMVFVTDSGIVLDGMAMGARYRSAERVPEAGHVQKWFADNGIFATEPKFVNEGGGDFLAAGAVILAGSGFRSDPRAHAEVATYFRREVVSLELVDPRCYHLNTALGVLADTVAYRPSAFSAASQAVLRSRFPDAIVATDADTDWLGLNFVCDGAHVVLAAQAVDLQRQVRARGYTPVPVDFSEFRKSGGGIRCATLTLDGYAGIQREAS